MTDPDAAAMDAWLADVEATAHRLTAVFRGAPHTPPGRPLTYAQQADEDRAAAEGEARRDAWQDADPFGTEAARAAAEYRGWLSEEQW